MAAAVALAAGEIVPASRLTRAREGERTTVVDPDAISRCFCPECVTADRTDAFGYWQRRLI